MGLLGLKCMLKLCWCGVAWLYYVGRCVMGVKMGWIQIKMGHPLAAALDTLVL